MSWLTRNGPLHALVAIIVVLCATALAAARLLSATEVGLVYSTALGFAAGRSGTRPAEQ